MKNLEESKKGLSRYKGDLTQKYKVREIGIFGSFVRGEQRKGSDVDILVEMEPEYQTFKNYMGLKFFLEEILDSKVDLVLKDVVKEQLKDRILSEVINV
jgi:Predicted nucleotidyltransferases